MGQLGLLLSAVGKEGPGAAAHQSAVKGNYRSSSLAGFFDRILFSQPPYEL